MNLDKVLFIGSSCPSRTSVQIRCIQIARHLNCDYLLGTLDFNVLNRKYEAFICVKPDLNTVDRAELANRGFVIWDILDVIPPRQHVNLYLCSTEVVQSLFEEFGRTGVIPHHHCNSEGVPNPAACRRVAWIGGPRWLPNLNGMQCDWHGNPGMTRDDFVRAYRSTGIGINLRADNHRDHDLHVALNSGIKLINCIGFGIPSVSADEPAYHELGEDCTVFTDVAHCVEAVHRLQTDDKLYNLLRANCQAKAAQFHIESIAEKYRELLESL